MIGSIRKVLAALAGLMIPKSATRCGSASAPPDAAAMTAHRAKRAAYMRDWRKSQPSRRDVTRNVTRESRDVTRDSGVTGVTSRVTHAQNSGVISMATLESRVTHADDAPYIEEDLRSASLEEEYIKTRATSRNRSSPVQCGEESESDRRRSDHGTARRHPMREDWQPDAAGRRLGEQAFTAAGVDTAIAIHRDTWISRPQSLTDDQWSAKWRAWCQLNIAPPLPLGPAQLALRRGGKKSGTARESPQTATPVQLPPEPFDPVWTPVRDKLVAELTEAVVVSWFGGVRLRLHDGTATLIVARNFQRSWIESKYDGEVRRAIAAVHAGTVNVIVTVDGPDRREVSNG